MTKTTRTIITMMGPTIPRLPPAAGKPALFPRTVPEVTVLPPEKTTTQPGPAQALIRLSPGRLLSGFRPFAVQLRPGPSGKCWRTWDSARRISAWETE
ncbi:MAG: hypothetical protein LBK52_01370 [Deltaproteobacteria bacterium]|nr:hypothetical protein [Deltaproteobacteria bacterium]